MMVPLADTLGVSNTMNAKNVHDDMLALADKYGPKSNALKYLIYCLQDQNDCRDYNLLRTFLSNLQHDCKDLILQAFRALLKDLPIQTVIDLGAGKSTLSVDIAELLPIVNKVICIDRSTTFYVNTTSIFMHDRRRVSYQTHNMEISEFLDSCCQYSDCNTLWLMSEYVHCKKETDLSHKAFSKGYVLLRELVFDKVIDERLRKSGGGLEKDYVDWMKKQGFKVESVVSHEFFDYIYVLGKR